MSNGWSIKHPRARKRHLCQMCHRVIDPGEVYLHGAGFGIDHTAWSWKECAHCERVRIMYDIQDGGEYNEDDLYEWSTNTITITELRHAAGYRMKWRTRNGTLLPLPEGVDHE